MNKKNNRVAGVLGNSAYNSNFNADFEGNSRSDSSGFKASNFSLKYLYRNLWNKNGYGVFYMKETNEKEEPLKAKEK